MSSTFRLINADVLVGLGQLPSNCVDLCITSPPYWLLRDYDEAGQMGLEAKPEQFLDKIADVFTEVRRILKPKGVLLLNLGDTYLTNWPAYKGRKSSWWSSKNGETEGAGWGSLPTAVPANSTKKNTLGIKVKELSGIPWRTALRLQQEGYYLRSEIIWHKPNARTHRVKDRPSVVHEHVFLLTKSAQYYHDGEETRPLKTVMPINNVPYSDSHQATFPPELIRPLVKAYCPADGLVLDPFSGHATSGVVAIEQDKNYAGIDIKRDYIDASRARLLAIGGVETSLVLAA